MGATSRRVKILLQHKLLLGLNERSTRIVRWIFTRFFFHIFMIPNLSGAYLGQIIYQMNEGLTARQAADRLEKIGPNIFWKERSFDWLRFVREQVFNPFNLILGFVTALSFFGAGTEVESLMILGFLLLSIAVSLTSEWQFHRLYQKLQRWLQKKVLVRRDGKSVILPSEKLVPDDLITITKGEKVPADGQVVRALGLIVDESVLTGESIPVTKSPTGDAKLFSGTEVIEGEADVVVTATGGRTEFAHIGALALATEKKSGYQIELEKFSIYLTKVAVGFVLLIFFIDLFVKGFDLKETLAFALVLGISIIPEFLPPITAFALTHASHLFARRKNIVKRLSAIEDLGLIDVLCVDKTGTITTNDLQLAEIRATNPALFRHYTTVSTHGVSQKYLSDYTAAIYRSLPAKEQAALHKASSAATVLDRQLFDPVRRFSQYVIKEDGGRTLVVIGAPESIIQRLTLPSDRKHTLLKEVETISREGLRVYAVARRDLAAHETVDMKESGHAQRLHWVGMGVFHDQLKPSAKGALAEAATRGVTVKILTGDRAEVAQAVSEELGLLQPGEKVWAEDELEKLSAREFQKVVLAGKVFARVRPEMKYKIVAALQRAKKTVGFLGEGMNDMPVIRLANVGIVVDSAIDAAKEVADIIILEKDLAVIVNGLTLGRSVFVNILKYLKHTMSDNFGNFFSVGFLAIFLTYLPLTPLQILLTDFLTDMPLFAVSYDSVDPYDVKGPSHYRIKELFVVLFGLGAVAAIFNLGVYFYFRHSAVDMVQTAIFVQATLSGLFVFYSIRTNRWFWQAPGSTFVNVMMLLSSVLLLLALYTPFNHVVGLVALPVYVTAILFAYNIGFLLLTDVVKVILVRSLLVRQKTAIN